MTRKLWALNFVLMALTGAVVWRIRENWLEESRRERRLLWKEMKPAPPTALKPAAPVVPVTGAQYATVASAMLFSRDRNPIVIVEVPKPKPMPPLPVAYGVVNLGDGPLAVMSEKAGGAQKILAPGQAVGEFKLVSLNSEQVVLEWEGQKMTKKLSELADKTASVEVAETPGRRGDTAAAAPKVAVTAEPKGPGVQMGAGAKACQTGDSSPAGTVKDGWKKVVTQSPFGNICRWEPSQ